MSLQRAIDTLEKELKNEQYLWGHDYILGFENALDLVKEVRNGSPDTQYKINLTKWIERKVCNTQEIWDTIEPKCFGSSMIVKLDGDSVYNFHRALMGSVKICSRTAEEGEG